MIKEGLSPIIVDTSGATPERRSPFVLKTNPTLQGMIQYIEQTMPNWEEIVKVFKRTHLYKPNGYDQEYKIKGPIGEIYVKSLLEELASPVRDIYLNPIPDSTQTKDYTFLTKGHGNYRVINRNTGKEHAEYDELTLVEGLPVVWEIKVGKSFDRAVHSTSVDRLFTPLQQYYDDTEFGYVLVITSDSGSLRPSLENFRQRGGLVTETPITRRFLRSSIYREFIRKSKTGDL